METSCFCFQRVAQIPDRREMGCRLPSQMWRADTRGCFSRSGHTSTSRPWGRRVRTHVHLPSLGARAHPAESCIELAPKTRTQNLKDKGAAHALSFLALMIDAK